MKETTPTTPAVQRKFLLPDFPKLLAVGRESILRTTQVASLITSSPEEVMALARIWEPNLIILGPQDVVQNCQSLKSSKDFRHIPLIALVPLRDTRTRDEVLETGCDNLLDYTLDEASLLQPIQDLLGLRFRKLPRLVLNTIAQITFKGRDFSSTCIDVNRQMIFLESHEGLVPATGRNVKMEFQLAPNETVTCWGRIERLSVRKGSDGSNEIIGLLVRFLSLPESTALRIEALAHEQIQSMRRHVLPQIPIEAKWVRGEIYDQIVEKYIRDEAPSSHPDVVLPENILKAFSGTLSQIERDTFLKKQPAQPLRMSISGRLKILDDIHKIRQGASAPFQQQALEFSRQLEDIARSQLQTLIPKNLEADILLWAKIKSDIIRSRLEIEAYLAKSSSFAQILDQTQSHKAPRPEFKPFVLGALVALLIAFAAGGFNRDFYRQAQQSIDLRDPKFTVARDILLSAQMTKPDYLNFKIYQGIINERWTRLAPEDQTRILLTLASNLSGDAAIQILFLDPKGTLKAAFLNGRVQLF